MRAFNAALFFPKGDEITGLVRYVDDKEFRIQLLCEFRDLADELYKNHNLERRVRAEVISWLQDPQARVEQWRSSTAQIV